MHSLIVSQNGAFHNDLDSTALIAALATPTDVIWLDIQDPSEEDIALLRDVFGFHPLAIEDAVRSHERPKVDAYAPAAGGRTGARLQNILREMDILHQRDQANEDTAPGDADAPTQRREQIETAGPGSYRLRLLLMERRRDKPAKRLMDVYVNGVRRLQHLDIAATAVARQPTTLPSDSADAATDLAGIHRAAEVVIENVEPIHGVIAVRVAGVNEAEAVLSAIEITP